MSVKYHDEFIAGLLDVDLALDGTSDNAVANSAVVNGIAAAVASEIITVSWASFDGTSLRYPISGTDSRITANHVLLKAELGTPSVQTGDWTVTTYDGYLTIATGGNITDATTLKLILGKSGSTLT